MSALTDTFIIYDVNIGENKRNEIGPYLASLVHHVFVVVMGLRCILSDIFNILTRGIIPVHISLK